MAEALQSFQVILQPHEFLDTLAGTMGPWVYILLFAVIFAETGLVIAPFLPGDSLLFAAGAIAAAGYLDIWILASALLVAAILGDAVNYLIGRRFGRIILRRERRFIKQTHITTATQFFERHGGKAIVLARFVPIVRTFAPFVAGMCEMPLRRFWAYNVSGGILWITLFLGSGYLFGNLPWVEQNLTIGMIAIVLISVVPVLSEAVRHRLAPAQR